ncbi:MAG: putative repeat protein (TIGR01451 family) [Aureispira sp.]|jgi:uncharacterized repeat protein (TIGR01451 family)
MKRTELNLKFKMFSILFFFPILINAQINLEWLKTTGSLYWDDVHGMTTDLDGNIYTTGSFSGTVDFDPGVDTFYLNPLNVYDNLFVQKLSPEGDFIWAKSMGGNTANANAESFAIDVDDLGNVYITGIFSDSIDFDPGPNVTRLRAISLADIFVVKLDAIGNLSWAKSMSGSPCSIFCDSKAASIKVDALGGVYLTGSFDQTVDFDPGSGTHYLSTQGHTDAFVQKLDSNGDFVWVHQFGSHPGDDDGTSLSIMSNGDIIVVGEFQSTVDFNPDPVITLNVTPNVKDVFILRLDSNGNLVWNKTIDAARTGRWNRGNSTVDKDDNIYVSGVFGGETDFDSGPDSLILNTLDSNVDGFIMKMTPNGGLVWVKTFGGVESAVPEITTIDVDDLGNVYTSGTFNGKVDFDPGIGVNYLLLKNHFLNSFIHKLDSNGNFLWVTNTEKVNSRLVKTTSTNDLLVAGWYSGIVDFDFGGAVFNQSSAGLRDIFITKINQKGVFGKVYRDYNQNCVQNNHDIPIGGKVLLIQPGNYYVTTNNSGYWQVDSLPIGTYTVTIDTIGNWQATCPIIQSFTVTNQDNITLGPGFGFIPTESCAIPNVSIRSVSLRPGFSDQRVLVSVCNQHISTTYIDSAYVIIELDSLLTVDSSTTPFINLGNNQYRIDLDTIYPNFCSTFSLLCTLDSTAILGQTLCLKAELYPIDNCILDRVVHESPLGISPCNTNYDESDLKMISSCSNDTIHFLIQNIGDNMTCYSQVRLYIDGQYTWMDSIQLMTGNSRLYSFVGDGRTWRLEVDQHSLHLGHSHPSSTIELCGSGLNWTPNLVNILPQDDADSNVDISCDLVSASSDPNDKKGYPLGIGSTHDILSNQDLEYVIRFQNVGTDTAFTVVIRDTLSTDLDIFSVESGVSSHDYTFRIYGPRVLEWKFENIVLPDSNSNESASHGFITFKVKQVLNLPLGTIIQNSAAIYFDFNLPIITNTSWHTINEYSIILPIKEHVQDELQITFYPNPTNGIVYIDKMNNESLDFLVVDNLGRVLLSKKSADSITNLDLSNLPSGVYFITVSNGHKIATQKIIKQ